MTDESVSTGHKARREVGRASLELFMVTTGNQTPVPIQGMNLAGGRFRDQEVSPSSENIVTVGRYRLCTMRIYRISLSMIFGLIGFGLNFWYVAFDFPPYEARLHTGLVFPLIISLAWGWRYGLLSATLGLGCHTLWFTPLAQTGLKPYWTISLWTLWVVWHGLCSSQFVRDRFPRCGPYLAELVFRVSSTVFLYTLLYGFLRWQTSNWATDTTSGVQLLTMINFKAVEQAVNGYVALLAADALLNLGPVRCVLRLGRRRGQRTAGYVIIATILFGLLFWIIDGLVDYYKFREHLRFLIFESPENLMDSILFNVSSPDLFARTAFLVTCLTGGVLVYHLLRKQLEGEAALRESELRYRRLHETMWDAFVQMDMSGRIVDFNHVFQQLIGHEKCELMEKREADLTPESWHAIDAEIIQKQVIPGGRSDVYEKEYTREDGSTFMAELRTFLITNDDGIPIGRWSIVRDITQRKKIENERERAITALKRSNEDLKQFAYVASHDLQEPLRMVASYTQLLAERYDQQLDEKAHKFINYAVDGAARMQALIRDLLSFSRVETHAGNFGNVDAHSALGVAIANLKTIMDETGTLLTTEDLPNVRADKPQLTQVFQNLINNGIKFRKASSVPTIHIAAQQQDGYWLFSVTDNGIGIDSQYEEKIFVVFQRLHTRSEYPGTGIGLSLCKRIIERHGGKIWFTSAPGKGTTFYFTIPTQTLPSPRVEEEREEAGDDEQQTCQAH